MKTTLVIGASEKPDRYAFKAITQLVKAGHPVIAFGPRKGTVAGIDFETEWNSNWQVDTVTLYINPERLEQYKTAILALHPKRVIFNPGTEHFEFIEALRAKGIVAEVACTLVLLSLHDY
ncbi:MAG: CoA-binding protein [Fluviicola sp.]|nr:CoA-binding protein [Fluviicola sp.]